MTLREISENPKGILILIIKVSVSTNREVREDLEEVHSAQESSF